MGSGWKSWRSGSAEWVVDCSPSSYRETLTSAGVINAKLQAFPNGHHTATATMTLQVEAYFDTFYGSTAGQAPGTSATGTVSLAGVYSGSPADGRYPITAVTTPSHDFWSGIVSIGPGVYKKVWIRKWTVLTGYVDIVTDTTGPVQGTIITMHAEVQEYNQEVYTYWYARLFLPDFEDPTYGPPTGPAGLGPTLITFDESGQLTKVPK